MDLLVCHLGQVEYREAAALQERLRERVIAGELPELMLLLEHPPVYTVTRRTETSDLPFPDAFYRERGVDMACQVGVESRGKQPHLHHQQQNNQSHRSIERCGPAVHISSRVSRSCQWQ